MLGLCSDLYSGRTDTFLLIKVVNVNFGKYTYQALNNHQLKLVG